jgi:hypothetical protein
MSCVFQTIDVCKRLVQWFKQAELQDHLDTSLKQENATRWGSMLRCLVSIQKNLVKIKVICKARGKMALYEAVDVPLLRDLIDFLCPFQVTTEALECFKAPTLHKVMLWVKRLQTHCQPKSTDVVAMKKLRQIVGDVLHKKIDLDVLHYLAAFLDPTQVYSIVRKKKIPADKMVVINKVILDSMRASRATCASVLPSRLSTSVKKTGPSDAWLATASTRTTFSTMCRRRATTRTRKSPTTGSTKSCTVSSARTSASGSCPTRLTKTSLTLSLGGKAQSRFPTCSCWRVTYWLYRHPVQRPKAISRTAVILHVSPNCGTVYNQVQWTIYFFTVA